MNYFRERIPSDKAANLVEFDTDSIRRLGEPDFWLADPEQYAQNGRLLRDSESPRMLAYSTKDRVLYATDGCNSCARPLPRKLDEFSPDQLQQFAEENELRLELLEDLVKRITVSS